MQQTETYELNLVETSDPFSPAPLNENTEKIEAALSAVQAGTAAGDAALSQRLTTLEAHKFAFGSYTGTGQQKTIYVGFTPKVVLLQNNHLSYPTKMCIAPQYATKANANFDIVSGGFTVRAADAYCNDPGDNYIYLAYT